MFEMNTECILCAIAILLIVAINNNSELDGKRVANFLFRFFVFWFEA